MSEENEMLKIKLQFWKDHNEFIKERLHIAIDALEECAKGRFDRGEWSDIAKQALIKIKGK